MHCKQVLNRGRLREYRWRPFPFKLSGRWESSSVLTRFHRESLKVLPGKEPSMLISSAAWAPGFHGPNGEWERCTEDTGLPWWCAIAQGRTGHWISGQPKVLWSRRESDS